MLGPPNHAREVLVALLAIVVLEAIRVVLVETFLAGKVDVAVLAHPVVTRVLRVLLVSSVMRKRPIAAIAVGHRMLCRRSSARESEIPAGV